MRQRKTCCGPRVPQAPAGFCRGNPSTSQVREGAYDRLYELKMGFSWLSLDPRYTGVRMLADSRYPDAPGLPALPRLDLLPEQSATIPAKARTLKPRVKKIMTSVGCGQHKPRCGGIRYLRSVGTLVDFDFGSRLYQLRFGVAINAAAHVNAPLIGGGGSARPSPFPASTTTTGTTLPKRMQTAASLIAAAEDMMRLAQ